MSTGLHSGLAVRIPAGWNSAADAYQWASGLTCPARHPRRLDRHMTQPWLLPNPFSRATCPTLLWVTASVKSLPDSDFDPPRNGSSVTPPTGKRCELGKFQPLSLQSRASSRPRYRPRGEVVAAITAVAAAVLTAVRTAEITDWIAAGSRCGDHHGRGPRHHQLGKDVRPCIHDVSPSIARSRLFIHGGAAAG